MRKMTKKLMIMFTMMMLSLFMVLPAYAGTVKLNKKSATIKVGKTLQLKVQGTKKKATWKSSDKAVATVSSKGVVTGKKAGTAKITAKVGKKKLSCKVTVKSAGEKTGTGASKASEKKTSNVWSYNGNIYDTASWDHLAFCNQDLAWNMVKARPIYMKYDNHGDLVAKIAVCNMTLGRNYCLNRMNVEITLPNKSVVAKGKFTWNNCIVNPLCVETVTVTFDAGCTKQYIDLTKGTEFGISTN